MENFIADILPGLVTVAGTVITGLVSWGLMAGRKYIKAKTDNVMVEYALTRVSHTVETVVAGLSQTLAASLRAKAEDGKLTADDASNLRVEALNTVKQQLPDVVKEYAGLGVKNLNTFILGKVEAAVLNQKGTGK